jgi:hypothetical protein
MYLEHCTNKLSVQAWQGYTTYSCGTRKNICIVGQLIANIFNDVQGQTKHHECSNRDGVAAFLNLTSNQTDMSTRLEGNISDVTSNLRMLTRGVIFNK